MRAHTASVDDFGTVGDGATSNMAAFAAAAAHLTLFESDGGAMLVVRDVNGYGYPKFYSNPNPNGMNLFDIKRIWIRIWI